MAENKAIIITGGASGIGREAAYQLAAAGNAIVVADFNEAGAKETVAAIEALGGKAAAFKVDVSKAEEAAAINGSTVAVDDGFLSFK
jgi:NAD(P)-dependent dehydrogenase (short-subunit alcohol dehydrogenase family)